MNNRLRRNLGRLGKLTVAQQADRALRRSCIGRVVSWLTFIFVLTCLGSYLAITLVLYQSGLADMLPEASDTVLAVGFFVGLIGSIVAAGLIGNWLRRRIWRLLLRRRR